MKTLFKRSTLSLSLFAVCLLMSTGIYQAKAQNSGTNTGIWDTYVLIGSAPSTFFVGGSHLQNTTALPFNNLDLGIFQPDSTLTLAGGEDYTAKVTTHANVCSGWLHYSVYPSGGSPTSWDSIQLGYTGTYGNVIVDSITNQEWSTSSAKVNILNGLAAGSYEIQIYFTSTGSDTTANGATNCATVFTENNGGANYTASFIIASSIFTVGGAGIWDTYIRMGASAHTGYSDTTYSAGGQDLFGDLPFNGVNFGTFTTLDTLSIAGGEDYSYLIKDTGNVCGGVLYYAVYDSGGSPGSFKTIALNYTSGYGNQLVLLPSDSLVIQEWSNTTNFTNVLTGLSEGTYYLQIYFSSTGSTVSTGSCNQTFVEFGNGANYTAKFKLTYPTGINNITNDNTWLTYPNPVTSQLNISTGTSITKADKIEVFDVLGRPVYTATEVTGNPLEIDMTNINTGTYFVRITTEQGAFVRTVVKE